MDVHFLKKSEFVKTKYLARECFGISDDLDEYYSKDIFDNRVAVLEDDGVILSMAHLRRFIACFGEYEKPVWYILYVGTAKDKRRLGYMDKVMRFVIDELKKEGESFAFLTPVDKAIYLHLGFDNFWEFNENERDILYADDELKECAACILNGNTFEKPIGLKPADTINDFNFEPFDAGAAVKYFDWFSIRPNKCCDSIPLDCFSYSLVASTEYCVLDERCFFMIDNGGDTPCGCIPFCREDELVYYFKLQEKYYNEVLHIPFSAILTDSEGVNCLKSAGALDNYEVTESEDIFDYIYSAQELRTLTGKKFAKKRNRISKFERDCFGRWEYRTLGYENREEIISFLKKWDEKKAAEENSENTVDTVNYINSQLDSVQTLEIDVQGTIDILNNKQIMSKIKAGGIYVDNKLCAFSLGGYNSLEKMAIIEIEKADSDMEGIYQLINREFLLNEFPQAVLVNREDDVGLPGLRKSKMSYNPIAFEKRYNIVQKY